MIDVSKLRVIDRCPCCIDRRVYAVNADDNRWLCVPSAMPEPWDRRQTIEHDATETLGCDDQTLSDFAARGHSLVDGATQVRFQVIR